MTLQVRFEKEKLISEMRIEMLEEKIKRINELYHKSQREGLTEEEKDEQARLRYEYIQSVRANLRGTLEHVSIQNEDGSITELSKKYKEQDIRRDH